MCYSQIWQNFGGDEYFTQIKQRIFECFTMKFVLYFLQHSETFDVSDVILPLIFAELSALKQARFWPTLYVCKDLMVTAKGYHFYLTQRTN